MDIILDDNLYDPKTINMNLPTFKANIIFMNLKDFLKSCIEKDDRSTAFYARLLSSLNSKNRQHTLTVV